MRTTVDRTVRFSASHKSLVCGEHPHGHDWFLTATIEGPPTPAGIQAARNVEIAALGLELHLRDLNAMVIGSFPTPEGIAGWALERLRLTVPGLRSVTVGFEGYSATVEV